jgi:hypothetical protein
MTTLEQMPPDFITRRKGSLAMPIALAIVYSMPQSWVCCLIPA